MKVPRFYKRIAMIMACLLLICLVVNGIGGKAALADTILLDESGFNPAGQRMTASELEAFTDELITRQLEQYHIAGAAVSIIQGDSITLTKGYGYADVENEIPVSADETIFRIGSTSKLFTWTAVMQLVEQGKIDLNADVNTYLPDFKIPATFPAPITMLNLLSHTAGFEERATGTEAAGPDEMISLHNYLATYMPDRVRPAGKLSTYSNYGAALAGYIVEAVSGVPFEQYIETNIFAPLGMSHSTFLQPVPANLADHLAKSYSYRGGFVEGPFEYPNLLPAATMESTANDMANFILANLQEGKFGDRRILNAESMRQIHSHLFSDDERLDGFAYGYMEWNFRGQRALWHGGDIGNWHSGLVIVPEQGVGFFIGYNSNESILAVYETYYALMDALFPAQTTPDTVALAGSTTNLDKLAGEYRNTRSVYNHIERMIYFPGKNNVIVKANVDGSLSIGGATWIETEPLVFTTQDGMDTAIFHLAKAWMPTHMQLNSNQLSAYELLPWYETATFNWVVLGASVILLLSAIAAYLVGLIRNKKGATTEPRTPQLARTWSFALSVVFLLVPTAIYVYLNFNYKLTIPFYVVIGLAIALLASVLLVGPVIFTLVAWIHRYWSLAGRLHYTLVTLGMLGMVWLMYCWRVLGFRY